MSILFKLVAKISRKMITKAIVSGNNIIPSFLNENPYVLICSSTVEKNFFNIYFSNTKLKITNPPIEIDELDSIIQSLKQDLSKESKGSVEWVVACGGGRVNDAAKYTAKKLKMKLCIIPPILSTTNWMNAGIALRKSNILYFAGAKWPDKVLFDTKFLLENPKEMHICGIADVLCCSSALYDWKLASLNSKEHFSQYGFEKYIEYIYKVISKPEVFKQFNEESLITILDYFIEAMVLCGASISGRPLEGSEHFVYYYFDEFPNNKLVHGKVIAITAILGLVLQGDNAAISPEKMASFYSDIGLDLKYVRISKEQLAEMPEYVKNRKIGYSILNRINEMNDLDEKYDLFKKIVEKT